MNKFVPYLSKQAKRVKVAAYTARAAVVGAALAAPFAFATGSDLDVSTAVADMKDKAMAGISTAGTAILAIIAAIVVLGIVMKVFKRH